MQVLKRIPLTPEQEIEIAREIRVVQDQADEAIRLVPEAAEVLRVKGRRPDKTRAAYLDRLVEAVARCSEAGIFDPSAREAANKARAAMEKAEELCWKLAMSGLPVARAEARKLRSSLMEEEDLYQEGIIGLLKAARRYDPERNIRFSTYARWWVRAQMTRAIEKGGRTVRLPGGCIDDLRRLRRAAARMDKAGVEYTLSELAEEAGVRLPRARRLMEHAGAVSIEQEDEDGLTLLDRLPNEGSDGDVEETTAIRECLAILGSRLDGLLDDREKHVVRAYYGLDDNRPANASQIGTELGLSRERVRQIRVAAEHRLREVM